MPAEAVVRARIDEKLKDEAAMVLSEMGLSVSDAIRMLMVRIAKERAMPFEVRMPNDKTKAAIEESRTGGGRRYANVQALIADMDVEDD